MRQMASLDLWDDFVEEISLWSRPSQTETLDNKSKFYLDLLPVNFGSQLETEEDGSIDRTALNSAINQLVKIIWQNCGSGFIMLSCNSNGGLYYYFCCCQDASKITYHPDLKRDRRRIKTFGCDSKLGLKLSLEDRSLELTLHRKYHSLYEDIRMGPDALRYIHEHCFTQSPSELYQNPKVSEAHGSKDVTQYQVYYRWKQANKSSWRRHDDQITSPTTLLTEFGNSY